MNSLKVNLNTVRARIERACEIAGRDPAGINIIAVSKRHSADRIEGLHALGQAAFGENFVQEALHKMQHLQDRHIEWHFIGPIQSNKTREIAQHFQWVQSVDRLKILQRLSAQRPASLPRLNVCIQVNIDLEPQKAGVIPEKVTDMVNAMQSLPGLQLRGLMAIPKPASSLHDPSAAYARMNSIFRQLIRDGVELDTLSMGMSADLEAAIMHGSTMVRIGTDLFGPRPENAEN